MKKKMPDNAGCLPKAAPSTMEEQDHYLALLPKSLHDYVMYQSISDLCTKNLYIGLTEYGYSEKQLLTMAKNEGKMATVKVYGKNYPL